MIRWWRQVVNEEASEELLFTCLGRLFKFMFALGMLVYLFPSCPSLVLNVYMKVTILVYIWFVVPGPLLGFVVVIYLMPRSLLRLSAMFATSGTGTHLMAYKQAATKTEFLKFLLRRAAVESEEIQRQLRRGEAFL